MAALFAASAVFLSCSCSGGEPDSGPVIGGDTYKAVSVQELIWRIRMKERKEQTLKYLKTIK